MTGPTVARTLVALFVVVAVLPAPAAADVRGRPHIEVYAPENRFVPGEETTLDVTLLNDAEILESSERDPGLTDVVTTARSVRVSVDASDAPLTVKTAARPLGNVPEGASQPVPFRVVVDEDAEPGRYQVEVNVRYRYTRFLGEADDSGREGVRYEEGAFETETVTIRVEPRAQFSVSGVRSNVSVGTDGTFTLALDNTGAAVAEDATVRVRSENPAVTVGTGEAPASSFVPSWESGQRQRFTIRASVAPDAVIRPYALTATVEYEDPDGIRRTAEVVPFGLRPGTEGAFRIRGTESDLRVGEAGRVTATVRNTGGTIAREAVLVIDSVPGTITPTEREVALGTLGSGEQTRADFEFDVSDEADPGPRRFAFAVEYRDADGDTLQSDPLDLTVAVDPERDVFGIVRAADPVPAGESDRFTLTIRNDGDEVVSDVSAKLFADDPLSATDDEAFVDRLAPGETTNVTFGVSVSPGALAKSYPVSLDFQYDDADGDTLLSDTYRVPVVVTARSGGGLLPFATGPALAVVGVLALAAVGIAVYRWRE